MRHLLLAAALLLGIGPAAAQSYPAGYVTSITINAAGHTIATYNNGQQQDLGVAGGGSGAGPAGPPGPPGTPGAPGVSIASAIVNGSNHLVLVKTDNTTVDAGSVVGPAGAAGAAGSAGAAGAGVASAAVNGSNHLILTLTTGGTVDAGLLPPGAAGAAGAPGAAGSPGTTGPAGVGITAAAINGAGHLVLTRTDGSSVDAGYVVGANGTNGTNGGTGPSGVGITSATVNGTGHLILTLTTGATVDAGYVVGAAGTNGSNGSAGAPGAPGSNGTNGAAGTPGTNGVGVSSFAFNGAGHLIVTLTNGTTADAGALPALIWSQLPAEAQNIPLPVQHPGTMTASETVVRISINQPTTIPGNFAGLTFDTDTNAAAATTFTVSYKHAGVWTAVGTFIVQPGGTVNLPGTGGIATTPAVSLVAGDAYRITGPATPDTTLADFSVTPMLLRV